MIFKKLANRLNHLKDNTNRSFQQLEDELFIKTSEKPIFIGTPMPLKDMLKNSAYYWSASLPEATSEKPIFIGTPMPLKDMLKNSAYYWSASLPEQIMAEWYVKSKEIMQSKEGN